MAQFSVKEFVSKVRNTGVARPTRFEVLLAAPPGVVFGEDLILSSMFCEIASLPQINISVATQRIYGPNYQNPISVDYGGDAITMTFYVDRDMRVKKMFDAWMNYIVDPVSYNPKYLKYSAADAYKTYAAEIRINQLDDMDQPVYSIKLIEAFPRNMGMMELNSSSLNMPHRLNVTFAYRKWEVVTEKRASATLQNMSNPFYGPPISGLETPVQK